MLLCCGILKGTCAAFRLLEIFDHFGAFSLLESRPSWVKGTAVVKHRPFASLSSGSKASWLWGHLFHVSHVGLILLCST